MVKKLTALAVALLLIALAPANAQQKTKEYTADSVHVLKNSATMAFHKDYLITEVSGVVGKEGIPKTIKLGDVITVKDRTLRVNYIFVTECLVNMEWGGEVLCEKGQVRCLVVERPEDVPSDRGTHRLWITVDHCRPSIAEKNLEGYKSPFVILPPIEWAGGDGSSPKEQAYFHGVLETYGFMLFGYWARVPESEQQFSDYRQCVENNRNRNWTLIGWLLGESLEASAAAQLVRETVPLVCREYAGKGNGGWSPPRIVSKREWQGYSGVERTFYVSAYIETTLELLVLMQRNQEVAFLTRCMESKGIDKILEKLGDIEVEWQYPMPWTVSTAVGSICKDL